MLTNIFYLGYLSNGNGSPIKAKHEPFIGHKHSIQGKTIYSLTGITWCWYCKENGHAGRIHVTCVKDGEVRLGCYNRTKGWDCSQKSTFLGTYEKQIRAYIDIFRIPDDYQQRILDMHRKLDYNNSKE